MEEVKIPESKFKVGDRVKIVNTQKTCSHLSGSYGTISDLFLSSDGNHYYELDNLSFESRKGKHTCFYAFIDSELEHATTKRQKEPKKEAYGFKHGDMLEIVGDAYFPANVGKGTIVRAVGCSDCHIIAELPQGVIGHDGKDIDCTHWETFSGLRYWYIRPCFLKLVKQANITIVSHEIIGNTTYVTLSNGDKGTARCNPEDEFDAHAGLKLATERAYGVEIAVKSTPYEKNTPKPKFEVGKKYVITDKSWKTGTVIEITDFKKTHHSFIYKFTVIKGDLCIIEFWEDSAMGKSLTPYEEPQVKEIKRQAKVGEYIKLTRKNFSFNKIGDILKVDSVEKVASVYAKNHPLRLKFALFANGENHLWHYTSYDYVVLENYKPEEKKEPKPKLKFKEGDYVYVRNATNGCQGAIGKNGVVTNLEATYGLLKSCGLDTKNVRLTNGTIWRVNTDGLEFTKSTL